MCRRLDYILGMSENLPSPQKIYTKKLNWPFRFWFGFERNILRNDICLIAFVALWLSTYFTSTIYLANSKYLVGQNLVQVYVRNWSALIWAICLLTFALQNCRESVHHFFTQIYLPFNKDIVDRFNPSVFSYKDQSD